MYPINIIILIWFGLAPYGGIAIDLDLNTLDLTDDFQDELKLETALNTEMEQVRNNLNRNFLKMPEKEYIVQEPEPIQTDDDKELMQNIERDMKLSYYTTDIDKNEDTEMEEVKQYETEVARKTARSAEMANFVGTNLFGGYRKKCFSSEDVALLAARKDFELLIPKALPQYLLSDCMVCMLMKYFNNVNQVIQRMAEDDTKRLVQKAFYDTLGGYLRYYLVPVTQVSFYAGKLKLNTVVKVIALYQQCKSFLNTNGNSWKLPISDVLNSMKNVKIKPLKIKSTKGSEVDAASCANLDLGSVNKEATAQQLIVALPKLEPEDSNGYLNNVCLAFKQRRIYNLRSPLSAFIVMKFYKTATRCYRFQCINQDSFDKQFKTWIVENVQVHFNDEQFYPGLGGILRIYENLKRGKKSVPVQDDHDDEDALEKDYTDSFYDESTTLNKDALDQYNDVTTVKHSRAANHSAAISDIVTKKHKEQLREQQQQDLQQQQEELQQAQAQQPAQAQHQRQQLAQQKQHQQQQQQQQQQRQFFNMAENANNASTDLKDDKQGKCQAKSIANPCALPPNQECVLEDDDQTYISYICMALGLLLMLLFLLICCCMLKRRRKSPIADRKDVPSSSPVLTPKSRSNWLCCGCFGKKKSEDEEILIDSKSESVQPVSVQPEYAQPEYVQTKTKQNNDRIPLPSRQKFKHEFGPGIGRMQPARFADDSTRMKRSFVPPRPEPSVTSSISSPITKPKKKDRNRSADYYYHTSSDGEELPKNNTPAKGDNKKKSAKKTTSWETMYDSR